ncbi:hypothetical protein Drorol1_Dr00016498, partial [Drosera rotundifolia]
MLSQNTENDCSFAPSLEPGNHSSADLFSSPPLRHLGLSSRLFRSSLLFSATHSSPLGSLATRNSPLALFRYPGTGEYDKFFQEGIYTCAGCGTPLYRSTTKFNSGCGWPAFFEGLLGAINRT